MEQPLPEMTSIAYSEFPTTPEIARNGVRQFRDVIAHAQGKTLDLLLAYPNVARCFVGITPEVGFVTGYFNDLGGDMNAQLKTLMETYTQDFIVASYPKEIDGKQSTMNTLLNLAAAEHVIKKHQKFFPPEAQEDTRQWLLNNPHEYMQSLPYADRVTEDVDVLLVRQGLLTGYSENSSVNFMKYQKARRKYKIYPGVLSDRQKQIANTYPSQAMDSNVQKEMRQILDTPGIADAMTEEDKQVILTTYTIQPSKAQNNHFGSLMLSTPQKDFQYMKQLDHLYEKSGIETEIRKGLVKQFVSGLQRFFKK